MTHLKAANIYIYICTYDIYTVPENSVFVTFLGWCLYVTLAEVFGDLQLFGNKKAMHGDVIHVDEYVDLNRL